MTALLSRPSFFKFEENPLPGPGAKGEARIESRRRQPRGCRAIIKPWTTRRVALIARACSGDEETGESVGIARAGGAIWRTAHSRGHRRFPLPRHVTPCTRLSPLLPSLLVSSIPLPFYPSGALHRATDRSTITRNIGKVATVQRPDAPIYPCGSCDHPVSSEPQNRAPGLRIEEKGTVSSLLHKYIYWGIVFFFFGLVTGLLRATSDDYSFIEEEYFFGSRSAMWMFELILLDDVQF